VPAGGQLLDKTRKIMLNGSGVQIDPTVGWKINKALQKAGFKLVYEDFNWWW